MTSLGKISPAELRRDNTTWVRDLKTGEAICTFTAPEWEGDPNGWYVQLQVYLGHWVSKIEMHSIKEGPCEGFEYIVCDGEPVAWIDEPPHSVTTDEICEAVFPLRQAAQ